MKTVKFLLTIINNIFAYTLAYIHSYFYKPKSVQLDLCNICQLDCAACWVRKNEEHIKKFDGGFGYVKFETFKKFVDENPFIKEIEVSHGGEIFLNPDINQILKYAYEKNIILKALNGVNLNYLPEETAENLVKYNFNTLVISIDGATPETYAIYRRKGDFNKVIEHIKLINKYKEKYNSNFPKLTYKFIVFGHNEHEIEDAKKLAKKLNMDTWFICNCVDEYSPVKNIENVKKLTGLTYVQEEFRVEEEFKNKEKSDWFYCTEIFTKPYINFNGDFLGCCRVYSKGFKVNIFKKGFVKALKNKNIIHLKAMILSDFNIKSKKSFPCNACKVSCFLKENKLSLGLFMIKKIFF